MGPAESALLIRLEHAQEGDDMMAVHCSCGFKELDDEEIIDHLHQVFESLDFKGNDGLVHVEGDRLMCVCGFTAITTEELDDHFLALFTPDDAIGCDGERHEACHDA
jgi:hypothetical protein